MVLGEGVSLWAGQKYGLCCKRCHINLKLQCCTLKDKASDYSRLVAFARQYLLMDGSLLDWVLLKMVQLLDWDTAESLLFLFLLSLLFVR